jgi:nucleoside-diphosphate-sugar epimerase
MPKVLIIGATGYLGLPIAQALRRTSNTVYGLLRSASKASILSSNEIIPVPGSVEDPSSYLSIIESANIDIVIDASATYDGAHAVLQSLIGAGKKRLEKAGAAGGKVPKLGYVYISGMWIHGHSTQQVNDLSPIAMPHSYAQPPAMLSWRPAVEKEILSASTGEALDVAIVRPALMYGRSQSAFGSYFGPMMRAAAQGVGELGIAASREAMMALVHVDDCAAGVAALVEKMGGLGAKGVFPVFDLMGSYENMGVVLEQAAQMLGFNGKLEFKGPGEDMLPQCMCMTVRGDSSRAKNLLGWCPGKKSMTEELEVHVNAFLGSMGNSG